jgi:hypothetical protein
MGMAMEVLNVGMFCVVLLPYKRGGFLRESDRHSARPHERRAHKGQSHHREHLQKAKAIIQIRNSASSPVFATAVNG